MDETQDETNTAQAVKATALIPYAEKVQLHAYQRDICYGKFDNKQELMKQRITVLMAEFVEATCYEGRLNELFQP